MIPPIPPRSHPHVTHPTCIPHPSHPSHAFSLSYASHLSYTHRTPIAHPSHTHPTHPSHIHLISAHLSPSQPHLTPQPTAHSPHCIPWYATGDGQQHAPCWWLRGQRGAHLAEDRPRRQFRTKQHQETGQRVLTGGGRLHRARINSYNLQTQCMIVPNVVRAPPRAPALRVLF